MDKELKVFLCIMLILFTISTIVLVVKNIEVEEPKTQKEYFCPLPNSKDEFLQNFENKNNQANIEDVIVTKYNYEDYEGLPVNSSMIIDYAYDMSTPEAVIGLTDYTVVVKINSIDRTEYRNPQQVVVEGKNKIVRQPYTIYTAQVIENISGELVENIEISQVGGLSEDKKSLDFPNNMKPLNIGEYYILSCHASNETGILEFSSNQEIELLGKSINNKIVEKYKIAAQNQIISEEFNREKQKSKLYDVEFNK